MSSFPHCQIHDTDTLLWVHTALLSLSGILVVASFGSQWKENAPYGRHADPQKARAWGPPIPQRLGHIISDFFPCVPGFILVLMLYAGLLPEGGAGAFDKLGGVNIALAVLWLLHYLYRGLLHPLIMAYSSAHVALGITLAGIFPNCLFSFLIAAQLACTSYPSAWPRDPRFIIGVALYALGYLTNRWADLKLRAGRIAMQRRGADATSAGAGASAAAPLVPGGGSGSGSSSREDSASTAGGGGGSNTAWAGGGVDAAADAKKRYFVPKGGLFELVACPNYLGELVEWAGYALACWSWPSLAWALFGASTFVPRALAHRRWYVQTFGDEFPSSRKALIPFLL